MDLFLLKKIISAAIMPLSIILILLICAIIFHKSKPKQSLRCLVIGVLLLILSSLSPTANLIMEPLEQQYEVFSRSAEPVNYIIILGCSHTSDDRLPATLELNTCSLQRLVEALRIYRLHPEAQVITSGFSGHDETSNAEKVKQAAIILGIPEHKIIVESFPKDTEEEAELIAPRVKGHNVVLITNTDHMPRSINYFKSNGVNVTAAPVGHWLKGNGGSDGDWRDYVPSVYNLEQTTTAWYEYLGLTVQWLKALFK